MECNKEEAIRVRFIAEKKMQCRDFLGAQKFALKAQQLFPDLENISQMLTVCEVHCAAETKVCGSEDWYGILQVEFTADELLIKKQYRKLALLLHPDKNKFAGAEAAFKLVGEAHRTLSDKATRSLYDMKRRASIPTVGRRAPPHQSSMSSNSWKQPPATNIYQNNVTTPLTQQQAQTANAAQTFWTVCPSCGTRYQYYRSIINKALRCQHCLNPFIAYDLNAPGVRPTAPEPDTRMRMKTVFGKGSGNKETENGQVETGVRKEQEVKVETVKFEKVNKRDPVVQSSGNPSSKRRRKVAVESSDTDSSDNEEIILQVSEDAESSDTASTDSEEVIIEESDHAAAQDAGFPGCSRRSTRQKHNVSYNEDSNSDNDFENLTNSEQLRRELHKSDRKMSEDDVDEVEVESNATTISKSKLDNRNKGRTSAVEDKPNGSTLKKKCVEGSGDSKVQDGNERISKDGVSPVSDSSTDNLNAGILSYPDPEFHDFDEDRGQSCFAVNQIWALYDDLDGMPRFYARIRSVSSTSFNLRFTWLEYVPVGQAEKDWFDNELPVGCGNFKHGKTENTEDIQLFSHIMPTNKDPKRNSYRMYPRKGEVWALFKDWDMKWSSDPDQHRLYEYEFVEVLSDFAFGDGANVRHLAKVKGFVSVFCQGGKKGACTLHIPPNELLRFSHVVPSYRMTGKEREGIPEGSYELDPASLPGNFEETFDSVTLEEVCVKDEHKGQVNGTQCLNSRTMERKSTNDSGNVSTFKNVEEAKEKIGIGKSLEDTGISAEGLKQTYQRRYTNGTHSAATRARRNMVDDEAGHLGTPSNCSNNVMENGNGSMSDRPCPMVSGYAESEFYDFHAETSKGKFQAGQVWALYCEDDGFPRNYALIREVTSEDFKVHITWLQACAVLEEERKWIENDLLLACGRFLPCSGKGADEEYDTTRVFSHMVQAELAGKRQYDIYPQVRQVWAVYEKWNAEWKISDLKNCSEKGEYEVVEVLSCLASMLIVLILEKVDGFEAVFKASKNNGVSRTMRIPRKEYLRFSHQIPSFHLTEERHGTLRGYWKLDAASLPDTLLSTNSHRDNGR